MVKTALERVLESPHGGIEFGKPIPKSRRSRRPLATEESSSLWTSSLDEVSLRGAQSSTQESESLIRDPLFKKGTQLYAYHPDANRDNQPIIPGMHSQMKESDLRKERLMFDTQLKIDPELGMKPGAKSGNIIKRVGKSKYGAFTVVRYPVEDRSGNVVEELRLVDLRQRARESDNPKVRFAQVTKR